MCRRIKVLIDLITKVGEVRRGGWVDGEADFGWETMSAERIKETNCASEEQQKGSER